MWCPLWSTPSSKHDMYLIRGSVGVKALFLPKRKKWGADIFCCCVPSPYQVLQLYGLQNCKKNILHQFQAICPEKRACTCSKEVFFTFSGQEAEI